jgi:hypothetical protein
MNVQNIATGITPHGVHILTQQYAVSRNGIPMATNGLMGCMAVVVHHPNSQRGCLGHVPPEQMNKANFLTTFLARCISLMNVRDGQLAELEIVFAGGSGEDNFPQNVANALNANQLTMEKCYDGRRQKRNNQLPFAQQITEAYSITYDPQAGTVYIGATALIVPPYLDDIHRHTTYTRNLDMDMLTSSTLATGFIWR